MSTAISRLVARATGQGGGLRPRLPARYEGGAAEAGISELAVDRVSGRPSAAPAPLAGPASRARSERPEQPAQTVAPSEPKHDPAQRDDNISDRAVSSATVPEVQEKAADPTAGVRSPGGHPRREGAAPVPPPGLQAPQPQRQRAHERSAPPSPLLPVSEGPLPAVQLPAPLSPPDAVGPQPDHVSLSEPDIIIEIGRLDVRTQPPRPATPRKPAPARNLPSLNDYLRGGGG